VITALEEFGRMFGSVRLDNVRLFGRSSAELRQTFGVIGASNWRRFGRSSAERSALVRWVRPNLRLRPNVIIWHSAHL